MSYQEQYKTQMRDGLMKLLDFFGGNKSQMAKVLGFHPQNGHQWVRLGRISKDAARIVDAATNIPLTKEDLRPDIKVWE